MNDTHMEAVSDASVAMPEVSAEHHFGWIDLTVAAAVVIAAGYYLYRSFWRDRGACKECGQTKGCCAPTPSEPGQPTEHRVPLDGLRRR
ncbi:hypothetical protein ABC977_07545 [Thioalkalicoccus limnaeus]|uniref:FeoB-associated Cys-rich membrane protein n=1 Tax=Thioalkalicoccus limnaeus TaxID=120681 RepID=A0ABV4BFG8_9GAMM